MLKTFGKILLFSIFVFSAMAEAQVSFWRWQPSPHHAAYVLPRVGNEAAEKSVRRYLSGIQSEAELQELLGKAFRLPEGAIETWSAHGKNVAFLLANDSSDMSASPARLQRFIQPLNQQGADTIVVPVAAEVGLSSLHAAEFRQAVASQAKAVLALGGDDNDVRLFGQELRDSVGVNSARDLSEMRLLKQVIRQGKAFVVGVCRGHQLILSILDPRYVLVQDIEKELGLPSHRSGAHEIEFQEPRILKELLSQLPGAKVNTLHHQGFINLPEDGPARVVATDPNGMVEATEFKNGKGFTTQFHPELMIPEVASNFARTITARMRQMSETGTALRPSGASKSFALQCKKILL